MARAIKIDDEYKLYVGEYDYLVHNNKKYKITNTNNSEFTLQYQIPSYVVEFIKNWYLKGA